MSYVPLKADMTTYFGNLTHALAAYLPYHVIPQIGLYMNGDERDGRGETPYDRAVAEGQFDAQIDAFCGGLRELQTPAFVRIGFEFNGPWNGYRPETFKAAWIRIASAFRRHHLHQVAAVWCYCPLPSTREQPEAGRIDRDYLVYYPGDDWVDWWSLDLFSPEMFDLDNTRWFLKDAAVHRFPVMIGESTPRWVGGVQAGEAAWKQWYRPFLQFLRSQPTVKAFCYINWAWDEYPEFCGWGDARIEANEIIRTRWNQELMDPIYVHATPSAAL